MIFRNLKNDFRDYSLASGSSFPVGITTVNVTATNTCGTVNCLFTVTVNNVQVPVFTSQPVTISVCEGNNAIFSAAATNATGYQWQLWNGVAWNNIVTATTPTLTVANTSLNMNTNSYRVVITSPCGTVLPSDPATLFVNPVPAVVLSATPGTSILPAQTTTLNATANPPGGTYAWFFNGTAVAGVTGSSFGPLGINDLGSYRVVYTSQSGCPVTSANLEIKGSASDLLWVYPNPNFGQFQVRFYNQANEKAVINIYDPVGNKVYTKVIVTGNTVYTQIDIGLGAKPDGIYTVELVDGIGNRYDLKRIFVTHR